jgi:hypothetical protein
LHFFGLYKGPLIMLICHLCPSQRTNEDQIRRYFVPLEVCFSVRR